MSSVSSHSKIAGSLFAIAAVAFAAAGLAGEPVEVLVDHDRVTEQRTNMPPREGPLHPIQVQAPRPAECPGQLDAAACMNLHIGTPSSGGDFVGTASPAPPTLKTGGQDVTTFGNK